MTEKLEKHQTLLLHPQKKIKGEGQVNTLFSQVNWVIDKTDIQNTLKVRSPKELIVHVYDKMIAATF